MSIWFPRKYILVYTSIILVYDITSKLENLNVRRIVLTDITKDGTLLGPNINLALELSKIYSGEIIVSGGVADYKDLESIKDNKLAADLIEKGISLEISPQLDVTYTGFNYVTTEKVVDIGPVQISKEKNNPVRWSPIVGGVLIAAGIVLLISSKKTTS